MTSCKKDSSYVSNNNQVTNYFIGSTVTLKANKCVLLKDTIINKTYNFCFTNIVKEDRCLKSDCSICIGSEAIIQVRLDSTYINLKMVGCIDEVGGTAIIPTDTLGLSFKLLILSPYPDTVNVPIHFNNYIAKINVSKI